MVKVATDSVSDVPPDVAQELGIAIIPLHIHFGTVTYRDKVDITSEEFYQKLQSSETPPTTSAPPPSYFADIFDRLAQETSEILAVVLSRTFSATYDAALQGVSLMKRKCRVEVVDSTSAIMGQGLLVIEAAKKALTGASLSELLPLVRKNIPGIHVRATMDTLKYLAKGGRIGKAQALLGSMLKINPILGIKDGVAFPFAKVRSRAQSIERLAQFPTRFKKIKAIAVEYGTSIVEARALASRIGSAFPHIPIYLSNVGPVIGTHTGPGVLAVSVLEDTE